MNFLSEQQAERLRLLQAPVEAFSRKIGGDVQKFDRNIKQFVNGLGTQGFFVSSGRYNAMSNAVTSFKIIREATIEF